MFSGNIPVLINIHTTGPVVGHTAGSERTHAMTHSSCVSGGTACENRREEREKGTRAGDANLGRDYCSTSRFEVARLNCLPRSESSNGPWRRSVRAALLPCCCPAVTSQHSQSQGPETHVWIVFSLGTEKQSAYLPCSCALLYCISMAVRRVDIF